MISGCNSNPLTGGDGQTPKNLEPNLNAALVSSTNFPGRFLPYRARHFQAIISLYVCLSCPGPHKRYTLSRDPNNKNNKARQ